MARLRYSRAQAEAEATRRAKEYVASRPNADQLRHRGTYPDSLVRSSHGSKHPVAGVAVFAPIPPDGCVMDGGELFVAVDLESGAVGIQGACG